MRALLAEFNLGPQYWNPVISDFQSALNEASNPRLGRGLNVNLRTPIETMTGIVPVKLLHMIVADCHKSGVPLDLPRARAEQPANLNVLQASMD